MSEITSYDIKFGAAFVVGLYGVMGDTTSVILLGIIMAIITLGGLAEKILEKLSQDK